MGHQGPEEHANAGAPGLRFARVPKKRKGRGGAAPNGEEHAVFEAPERVRFARVLKKKAATKKRTTPAVRAPRKKPTQKPPSPETWLECVRAAEAKKASAVKVLDLRPLTSFADYFIICSGSNQRQNQAICDEVTRLMKLRGELPVSVEGYDNAEWILVDYGDVVVHIFSEKSRLYYDLDRLWRDATPVEYIAQSA